MKEIDKTYNAASHEENIYKKWENSGAFKAEYKAGKRTFTISMPPPNATGTLHLGHAVMLALEDIMTRYHRMKGETALWLPGTDHASIATQNKVEQLIAKEGKTRFSLGREKFLERVNEFVKNSRHIIKNQIRSMGSSCDWSREKYTLSPELSLAVRTVFKRMYDDGLIYRGYRIVNWCPRCKSTLADDEVEYKEIDAKLYYIKYGPFIIATTRPETKVGDTGAAVNPSDRRYKKYVGKTLDVNLGKYKIQVKVIADKVVDVNFGTGVVGVTPAHSFEDFEMARKHKLDIKKIIDEDGKMTNVLAEDAGMNAAEFREKFIENLKRAGLLKKEESYKHNLSICYRCDTPIEPLPSEQWFINVDKKVPSRKKSLKEMAIEAVKSSRIKILPKRFEKIYFHWMNNLHDWCISRQIWFGHQIPVWYCVGDTACKRECKNPIVEIEPPKKCPHCGSKNLRQDPDTLDTWFSSGLWTFSTLGWPAKTPDLKHFHPTSVMETGYDILFFWIARMILMTLYALNDIPFKTVYLHGLIRDRFGNKMSKSRPETCIDPLDMIKKYGTDAVRLSLAIGSSPGNDMRLYEEKIAGYRNFVNKIWNASRFVLMNLSDKDLKTTFARSCARSTVDKWILSRLQKIVKDTTQLIEEYRFSEAGSNAYDFFWSVFCDWCLELSKDEKKNPVVLAHVLKTMLKLLHPFMPFVTEVIWSHLGEKGMLISAKWPAADKSLVNEKIEKEINAIINAVSEIRSLRADLRINAGAKLRTTIYAVDKTRVFEENAEAIKKLAGLAELNVKKRGPALKDNLRIYLHGIEIYISIKGIVDIKQELERINKEIQQNLHLFNSLKQKLANQNFIRKAPEEIVGKEKLNSERVSALIKKLEIYKKELEHIIK